MEKSSKSRYKVPALEKGLLILEKLVKSEHPLRFTDIHEQLEIPKTSVFMILSTLEAMDFIEKVDDNRYRTTIKIYNLGMDALLKYDVRLVARPFMEDLAGKFRYTVHLAILSQDKALYIAKVNGPSFVQFGTKVGHSVHIHCSAVGKVLAAYLPEERLEEIIGRNPLKRFTENTITNVDSFKSFLATVRKLGYAIEDEEGETGIRCIGSPIFDNQGETVAALSITAVRADLSSIYFQEVGTAVKEACLKISELIGYTRALK